MGSFAARLGMWTLIPIKTDAEALRLECRQLREEINRLHEYFSNMISIRAHLNGRLRSAHRL